MIKTIIAVALLTSSCSVVKASNINSENFDFDKSVVYKTKVISNKEMIYIDDKSGKKGNADENIKSKQTFDKWKSIIKDRS